jgi:acetyltransferase-like isoleucine patch superfamily enzyme
VNWRNLLSIYLENITKHEGTRNRIAITFGYFRGFLVSPLKFKKRTFVCIRGKIDVSTRNGDIDIGDFVTLYKDVKLSSDGTKNQRAILRIGQKSSIGDRTEIHAGKEVKIGNHVFIAWDVVIMDRDYHAIDGLNEKIKPVTIENDAWICCRAIILKGVTVGHHAIVGAGAVVSKNVEPYSIVAGNPARVVGKRHIILDNQSCTNSS